MMMLHPNLRRASVLLAVAAIAVRPAEVNAAVQRENQVPGGVVPLGPDPTAPPIEDGIEGLDDFLDSAPAGSRRAAGEQEDSAEASAAEPAGSDGGENIAARPAPFDGSLGAGLAEVERLAAEGEVEAALETADRLLAPDLAGRVRAWLERREGRAFRGALGLIEGPLAGPLGALGLDPLDPEQRSEVHYARGAALRAAERDDDARASFRAAVGLGGPARLDAAYELGHIALTLAEEWRSKIPEIAQATGAPPSAPPAGQGAHGEEEDPLAEARAAYERALDAFVERLRLDWRHADSRANVELIRRRLAELDDLERQREEEQQEQQEGDPSDQPQDGQEGEPEGDESSESEQDPAQEPPEPSEESEEQEADEQEAEEEPSESESDEGEEEGAEERPEPEPREVHMTQEEMERLLGRLQEHQQRGEEVQEALNARRRRSTARDW